MSIDPRDMKAPDPSQWDEYDKPRPLVPAGRYTGRTDSLKLESDNEGNMRGLLDTVTIVDAPSGFKDQIRFERLSSKPREKGRLAGTSRLTDYLLATGTPPVRSGDSEEWAAAFMGTQGAFFDFFVDWRAWDSETEEELAGSMEEFPLDSQGERQSWVVNPKTGKRVAGQYRIRYFIRQRGR